MKLHLRFAREGNWFLRSASRGHNAKRIDRSTNLQSSKPRSIATLVTPFIFPSLAPLISLFSLLSSVSPVSLVSLVLCSSLRRTRNHPRDAVPRDYEKRLSPVKRECRRVSLLDTSIDGIRARQENVYLLFLRGYVHIGKRVGAARGTSRNARTIDR